MSCTILTPERWKQFLKNGLTKEETAELIAHLETACPDCDQFFSQIQGSTEHNLRRMFNDIPEDELDFIKKDQTRYVTSNNDSSVRRVDNGETDKSSSRDVPPKRGLFTVLLGGGPFSPALAGGLAVVVLLAVGLVVQLQVENMPLHTEKGISEPAISSINLQFATGHRLNDEFVVERGINGGQYSHDDSLYLHYELPAKGFVYLIGYQGQENVDVLYPGIPGQKKIQDIGQYSIPAGNNADKGIPLTNISGRYQVIGIYSPDALDFDKQIRPLIEQSVDAVTGSIDQQRIKSLNKNITVDLIFFDVQA